MNKLPYFLALMLLFSCVDTERQKELVVAAEMIKVKSKSEIEIKRERMEMVQMGNLSPKGKFLDKDSITISTDDFNGKLLVIDFWATWCAPCLEQMSKFKELESKYESDKVEFLTLSVNEEYKYWKEFIAKRDWKTDNYWLGMDEANPFFAYTYSLIDKAILMSLPKYVIIGPKGKILNNAAPKPSHPDFEKELVELIREYTS